MNEVAGDAAEPDAGDARSPQQRRLAGLIAADGERWYRTVCRVRLPEGFGRNGFTEARLRARADPVIRDLLAATGQPVPESAPAIGRTSSRDAPAALSVDTGTLTVDLPAACADETTVLAVLREILGAGDGLDPTAVPHATAATWWNTLAGEPSAIREFWRARAADWNLASRSVLSGPPSGPEGRDGAAVAEVRGTVAPELTERLRAAGPSPAWLLAAWQLLLRRHTTAAGLVLGVATDLRQHEDLRGCRGPLTAYLPVRSEVPDGAPLAEHARVAAAHLSEGTARAAWFDWDDALGDGSVDGRGFAYGFRYAALPTPWHTPMGVVHVEDVDARGDRFAVRLICQEAEDSVRLRLEYDPGFVSAELATDLIAELPVLLAEGLAAGRPAAGLTCTTPEIRDRLRRWGTGPDSELPEGGLPALVRATAARCPDAIAVRDRTTGLTYRELVARMDGLAAAIAAGGATGEDRIAVGLPPCANVLVAFLAVQAAGCAYLYLDPTQPADRLGTLAASAGARLEITDPAASAPVTDLPGLSVHATGPARTPPSPIPLDSLAYVIHTSGSTGVPKGIEITHRGLINYLTGLTARWPAVETSLVSTRIAFDIALPTLYLPLLAGGTVVFGPSDLADPVALVDELTGHPYSLVRATPSQLRLFQAELAARGGDRRPVTRCVAAGGEPLPATLARAWTRVAPGTELVITYGPAETVGARTLGPVHPGSAGPTGTIPIGAPIANTTLLVLDTELAQCPLGMAGELYIGGTGLARGYLGRPAATAERFVPDPLGPPGARVYRTGDVVRWLPGRRLEFVGRTDDQVKVHGYRIEPAEVVAALTDHPAVREAVVIKREDDTGTGRLVGYAVAEDTAVPADDLRRYLAARLPDYLLPASVVWIDALPVGANGKLDRSALPEPDRRPDQSVEYQPPRTPAERILAEVWAEALGLDRVGVHDNFFAIGGDSILSILVTARAAKRGLKLSLRHFFDHQTVAAMAPHAEPSGPGGGAHHGDRVLTPIQHYFFEQDLPRRGHWNQGWLFTMPDDVDATALAAAVTAVVRQHPALRGRFLADPAAPGGWRPERGDDAETGATGLRRIALAGHDWPTALDTALAELQEIDVSAGPMLRVALVDGGPGLCRLALIAHHLAIDTVSWQILFEDLGTAYRQAVEGRPIDLPAATLPPDEWGAALAAAVPRAGPDLPYWLDQCPADLPDLPVDHDAGPPYERDRRELDVVLDRRRTGHLLRRVPVNVRIDYVLTTAVALAVADWTGQPFLHLVLEGQGRAQDLVPDAELYRSVGWYTALAPLLIRLPGTAPLEALRAVREQFRAIPHDGVSYGVLRYQDPEHGPLLAARPRPRISVNYVGHTGGGPRPPATTAGGLRLWRAPEPMPRLLHPDTPRTQLWHINGVVREDRLHITVDYAGRHYEPATARRVATGIGDRLATLVDALMTDGDRFTPADFPLAGFDHRSLDSAVAQALARAPRRPGTAPEAGRP